MNREELTEEFMELFKNNNCNVGDILLPQWVLNFLQGLDPEGKRLFPDVVQDLESRGYFTSSGGIGREQYRLNQAGYDFIYRS